MKSTHSRIKALLTLLVTLVMVGVLTVVSFAADKTASYDNKYGQIVPTNSKLEARKTSFSFKGDSATLYFMRISEGEKNANYAVEIYADKACTELIRSLSGEFEEAGNKPLAISWKFKNTHSGTYYGKCYAYVSRSDGNVIDTDSVETFKIKIDRLGKRVVALNSVKNTSSGIKVTWSPIKTATTYKVYRKAAGDKKWKVVKTLGEGAYTYTDKKAKSGKKYSYTVRCFDGKYKSSYNKKGLSATYLSTPKLSSVRGSGSNGYAKITWKKVSGAKGYEIYRKGGSLNSSKWKKIATVKGSKKLSYTDKTAKKTDWYYTYSVRAYGKDSKSSYNTEGLDFNYIKAPKLTKVSSVYSGMKVQWKNSNKQVTSYIVYRKKGESWKKLGKTQNKYFIDKTAKSGKTYIYTVKAACDTNAGAYKASGIKGKYLAAPKLNSVTFNSNNYAKVSWSKVNGAAGYRVYRKINSATSWTKIADIKKGTKLYYYDKVAKTSGSTYKYMVRAVNGKIVSGYNSAGTSQMYLSIPSVTLANKALNGKNTGVNISWKAVTGATGYNVYRRVKGTTAWTVLATKTTALSYYDSGVSSGTCYDYAVRAVNGTSLSRYTIKNIIALQKPVVSDAVIVSDGVKLTWNTVKGADTYYVYRKPAGGKWSVIGSYALNSFVDKSKEAKTGKYFYMVIAEADGYRSDYDNTGTKNFVELSSLQAKFIPATETESPRIAVEWVFGSAVDSIELFKNVKGEKPVSLGVFTVANGVCEYVDFDITIGTEYVYTAKAIKSGKLSTQKTANAKYPHAPVVAVEFDVTPTYAESGSYVTVNWTSVEFASEYEIYRKYSADKPWTKIATVSASQLVEGAGTYIDEDVDTDITYYYTVKGVASDRDSLYNEEGKTAKVLTPIEPATGIIVEESVITVTTEDGTIEKTVAIISWDEVENADYYRIMRKTANSDWAPVGFLIAGEPLKFTDDTIRQGVKYTYTILTSAAGRGEAINEIGMDFCWEFPEGYEPEEPTTEPEEPTTEPEEPTTEPEEPTTEPEEPTTEPEEPTTEAEEPTTEPEDPTTEPEEPTTEPEEPTTEPEEPTTEPEEPTTEPEEPTTEPTEPEVPGDENTVFDVNIEEKPLEAYQKAVSNIREKGSAGYTKKTWQELSKDLVLEGFNELMLPEIESEYKNTLDGLLISESEAEAVVYEKGSVEAADNIPLSNCSAEKVKSATAEKSGDNYVITIVMLDQTNCSKTDSDGLNVMSNDIFYAEDREGSEILYKEYTITATITANGEFVEIKHYCNADVTEYADIIGMTGTGYYGTEFETIYSDFIY